MDAPSTPRPVRTLVADDDPAVLRLLAAQLAHLGASPDPAPGGADAIRRLGHREYDLVLSDLEMPDADGLQVLDGIEGVWELLPREGDAVDAVVIDAGPGGDALELRDVLRGRWPGVRVLVALGFGGGRAEGSVTRDTLLDALETALDA